MKHDDDYSGYEGFDGTGPVRSQMDVRKDGLRQARIWIGLAVVICFNLFFTVTLHMQDIMLMINGNSITVDRHSQSSNVDVVDENGTAHSIKMDVLLKYVPSDKVTLYYYGDDISKADVLYGYQFWLMMYGVWVPLLVLCIRGIYKNMHEKKKHATAEEGHSKFDD